MATCGDPAHGFMWLRCDPCAHDCMVAFSCKTIGVCPRCGGRRMASTAAHLHDHVLPDEALRQWVFTFPQPLPRVLAWEPDLLRRVLAVVARSVQDSLRRRTRQSDGRAGIISFVQTFTGDLRLFVHFHVVAPGGAPTSSPRPPRPPGRPLADHAGGFAGLS